jgi:D-alanyl-D-alanine carboxypeptidase/D-alanyl-D-alanine-endopeptidase (penicillin-binding protein 4)
MLPLLNRRWQRSAYLGAALTALLLTSGGLFSPSYGLDSPDDLQQAAFSNLSAPALSQGSDLAFCQAALSAAFDPILNAPTFRSARWGVVVQPLDQATSWYSRNANTLLIPASNIKLFTTAAALEITNGRGNAQFLSRLLDQIRIINLNSNNSQADSLLGSLGGQVAVRNALIPLGIDPDAYRQADGSGLSRSNLTQPAAIVSLLRAMHGNSEFYRSLPVAGRSGTLRNRFNGTAAQGRVFAKTGTLNGVRALSGYLEHPTHGTLVFSIMVNQPGQSGTVLVNTIDRLVLALMQLESCG